MRHTDALSSTEQYEACSAGTDTKVWFLPRSGRFELLTPM